MAVDSASADRRDGPGVTEERQNRREMDRFYDRLDAIEREMRDGFSKLGSQFAGQYQVIIGTVEDQRKRLEHHSGRLIVVEEQQRYTEKQKAHEELALNRRLMFIGILSSAGTAIVIALVKSWFGH